jgi:hypothetical protein
MGLDDYTTKCTMDKGTIQPNLIIPMVIYYESRNLVSNNYGEFIFGVFMTKLQNLNTFNAILKITKI